MTSYVLLLPSLIGVGAFLLLPILVVAWLSVHSWNLLGPMEFVGLRNWRSVLRDPAFGHALLVTSALTAIVVPVQTVLGFAVAALLARRGVHGLRVLYALPWMCCDLSALGRSGGRSLQAFRYSAPRARSGLRTSPFRS